MKKAAIVNNKLHARRKLILDTLGQIPICTIQYLSETAKVSTETIRKDLGALANEGLIVKVHGGAALANGTSAIPFGERATHHAREKKRIVKAAVALIASGDTVILESCTTNLELAKLLLTDTDLLETLTVITNSFPVAELFENGKKCRELFFLGGKVYADQRNTHGSQTAGMLKEFRADKAFLSGAALSGKNILSAYYEDDALFQKAAIEAADKIILMIDHSKFEKTAVFSVADLSLFDYIVSDKLLSPQEQSRMESEYGVRWLHVV